MEERAPAEHCSSRGRVPSKSRWDPKQNASRDRLLSMGDSVDLVDPVDPLDVVDPVDPVDLVDPVDPVGLNSVGTEVVSETGMAAFWISKSRFVSRFGNHIPALIIQDVLLMANRSVMTSYGEVTNFL